jgi:hypothetical protein
LGGKNLEESESAGVVVGFEAKGFLASAGAGEVAFAATGENAAPPGLFAAGRAIYVGMAGVEKPEDLAFALNGDGGGG